MGDPSMLSDMESVLRFERDHEGRGRGQKESDIRKEFGTSAVRYYQSLNRIIDTRDALEFDAGLVNRLLEARRRRTESRQPHLGRSSR